MRRMNAAYGYLLCIFIAILCRHTLQLADGAKESAEYKLYTKLLGDYVPTARPVLNSSHPVHVQIGLAVHLMHGIDDTQEILTMSGWLTFKWKDEYLTWNETEYNGVKTIIVAPRQIWTPDIAHFNSAGTVFEEMHYLLFYAGVKSDGTVSWQPGGTFKTQCRLDITYYPFDYQVCHFTFITWINTNETLSLSASQDQIDLRFYQENGEWDIISTDVTSCCPNREFPYAEFRFNFKRRSLFFVLNLVIPVLFLTFLELLVFVLPCESGEKVSLAITVMLSFTIFTIVVQGNIPQSSTSTPIIVIYIIFAMGLATVSVFISVLELVIYNHATTPDNTGSREEQPDVTRLPNGGEVTDADEGQNKYKVNPTTEGDKSNRWHHLVRKIDYVVMFVMAALLIASIVGISVVVVTLRDKPNTLDLVNDPIP